VRTLFVYTDASVRGHEYHDRVSGRTQRYLVGPATAACVGWLGQESSRTTLEAKARLDGLHGPQTAEHRAVQLGLANALTYVANQRETITHVLLCSDNEIVISTLTGWKAAQILRPYRSEVREIQGWLEQHGVEVNYERVLRKDPRHQRAHQLADRARHAFPVPPSCPGT
jgi:hypothetical protein